MVRSQERIDQQTSDGISSFPGQRRDYVKTNGNALEAVSQQEARPQENLPQLEVLQEQQTPVQPPEQPQEQKEQGELVAVTVPEGLHAGQMIHVKHPDGSGRLIGAQIPEGMSAGSAFYVRAPPRKVALPPPVAAPVSVNEPVKSSGPPSPPMPMAHAEPLNPYSSAPPDEPSVPFSQCLDTPGDIPTAHRMQHTSRPSAPPAPETPRRQTPGKKIQPATSNNLALLRVRAPPGVAPGSTILVQVPGENRKIAAKVPPNCTEFHVQYQPQTKAVNSNTISNTPSLVPQAAAAPPRQKLLKVNVPPGLGPGDFLHVQIPGEPGRLVKAQVPPGNVREFNVAYEPRTSAPQHHQPTYNNSNNYNGNGNNDNYGAAAALPIAGGLVTAAAGAMVYDHFAHHRQQ
eukprot:CAMPEP_0117039918 /NCGR_PEP_ID=MMETSP0472-20121206/27974_1 /TAXON_ID=693140 ORGANISM="Tiarina fusus, Strain LIS" /NCGR_SAMPLE_ID=MMETSP0472 /ASSEMBLY_ACC=CAM_ASM_000603 /LENGTH=400 /DNA_ID=CAMNT_0004750519 /DNA_START=44 /DNA_END=1247 /DNA_ORIENTATION=+